MAFFGGLLGDVVGAPFSALGLDPSSLPVVGGLFENPAAAEYAKAAEQARKMLEERQKMTEQARMSMIEQGMQTMQPYGRAVEQIYGPQAGGVFDQVYRNPMPQQAAPQATGKPDYWSRMVKGGGR